MHTAALRGGVEEEESEEFGAEEVCALPVLEGIELYLLPLWMRQHQFRCRPVAPTLLMGGPSARANARWLDPSAEGAGRGFGTGVWRM
jgi:hypothetical protein